MYNARNCAMECVDIAPHSTTPLREAKRHGASSRSQLESFHSTFRSNLYSDLTNKPTDLAMTNRELLRRKSLIALNQAKGNKKAIARIKKCRRESLLNLNRPVEYNTSKPKAKAYTATQNIQIARRVLNKQTNVSLYTGIHRHRFDASTGKGLGNMGRDTVFKGPGHIPYNPTVLNRPDSYYLKHGGLPTFMPDVDTNVPDPNRCKATARDAVMKRVGHLLKVEEDDEDYEETLFAEKYIPVHQIQFVGHEKQKHRKMSLTGHIERHPSRKMLSTTQAHARSGSSLPSEGFGYNGSISHHSKGGGMMAEHGEQLSEPMGEQLSEPMAEDSFLRQHMNMHYIDALAMTRKESEEHVKEKWKKTYYSNGVPRQQESYEQKLARREGSVQPGGYTEAEVGDLEVRMRAFVERQNR